MKIALEMESRVFAVLTKDEQALFKTMLVRLRQQVNEMEHT